MKRAQGGLRRDITPEHGIGWGLRSVITLHDFASVPPQFRSSYLSIGNFDGVHLGHADLLARLRARADEAGTAALPLTFDPQPVALLRPDSAPVPLVWIERKVELLKAAGATDVGVYRTGTWLLSLTAREFFDRVIVGQFAARGLVEGPTFRFGRDRVGDVERLAAWCAGAGIDFEVAKPTELDGQIVSSTRIRHCLNEGQTDEAARLLGRPHRIRGIVVRGAGRGAGLGFPTANLDSVDTQIPADGVYSVRTFLNAEGPPRPAACHIGPNATFGERNRSVEVHVIDFTGDLYGQPIEVDFLLRLRPTRRFDNLPSLLDQMRVDVDQARDAAL
jgi:riboflavin kinase / FMN adenylyltransferase